MYPNPVLLPAEANRLYLFWRGADWSADFATRTAAGNWSGARELIRSPGQRPYVKVADNGSNLIALAFTNGHPRDVLTSVYYAAYRNGSLWRPGGTWITRIDRAPIAPRQTSLVYDAAKTHAPAWVWDVAVGRDGRPVIVYATFPPGAQHVYWYARFDGRRWISHELTRAGGSISPGTIEQQYSGGVALDHTQPATLYLSRQVHGGWQIERWSTPDGGAHWRRSLAVPADGTENVRPVVRAATRRADRTGLAARGVRHVHQLQDLDRLHRLAARAQSTAPRYGSRAETPAGSLTNAPGGAGTGPSSNGSPVSRIHASRRAFELVASSAKYDTS